MKSYWTVVIALVLILSACNLPTTSTPELSIEAQAGTLAAQTIAASITQRSSKTPEPQNTPTKSPPTLTPTPIESLTPTITPHPLIAPSLQKYDFFCSWNGSGTQMEIKIKWTDHADNELGYRIYRGGTVLAELGANSTEYTDIFSVVQGQAIYYAVEAFNENGASKQFALSAACE